MPVAKTAAAKTPAGKTKAGAKPPAKSGSVAKAQVNQTPVEKIKTAKSKYDPLAPQRVQDILNRLDQRYPNVKCALHHNSAWELLIATILSAQCTDVMVNKVTPRLFQKYPTPQAMAAASPEQLEPDLRPTGFFRNKAKSVVGASKGIVENFGGGVLNLFGGSATFTGTATVVPEPMSLALTGTGLLGIWLRKKIAQSKQD